MEFESAGILWLWGIKKVPHYLTDALKRTGTIYKCVEHTPGSIPNFKFDPAKDVVLALGDKPVQELRDFGLVKKKAKLNSCRENIVILPSGVRCLVSYSPAIREIDYNSFVLLECDVQLAARLLKTGSLVPPPLDFKWVPDLTEVLKAITAHHNKWVSKAMDVAIDLETTGLVAYNPDTWIITFQISIDEKSSRVLKFDKDFQPTKPNPNIDQGTPQCREELIWVQINQILNDPLISLKGANLKYDLGWIYEKWGIACTNFRFDTLLVGSLLDENRSNSLKVHASLMTPYGGYENALYKKYNIAKLQEVPDDVLLPYCGYDTAVCLQVARIMKSALLAPGHSKLAKFYVNILHPAARAYERVERVGVLVDLKYYQEFKTSLEASLTKSQSQANAILPRHLHAKFEAHKDITNLSLSRAVVSAEYMFGKRGLNLKPIMFTPKSTEENPKPSTAEEHFLKFKDDPLAAPFIKVLSEYKDCEKTLSTYVDGFLSHLRYDNRFHAGFFLFKGQDNTSKKKDAGTNCFPAGELILTTKGNVPIEKVKVGDLVLTHRGRFRPVTDAFVNGVKPLIQVILKNGSALKTTRNHPYYTSAGWVNAEDLTLNHQVFVYNENLDNLELSVSQTSKISGISHCRGEQTYGITVEEDESHVSGKIVTHNTGRISIKDPALQTVPKHTRWSKPLRRAFIAPEGYVLMSCLPYNAPILTTVGLKKIGDIKIGDNVLVDGNPHAVTFSGCTGKNREVYRVRTRSGRYLDATGDHKIWVLRGDKFEYVELLSLTPDDYLVYDDSKEGIVGYTYYKFEVIEYVGEEDVYDITVDTVHCFNAYGFRVHNCDYSQGELRIAADLSGEENMLSAYNKGIDLHAFTGAGLAGIPVEEFLAYKDSTDPKLLKLYEDNRQKAKGCIAEGQLVKTDCGDIPIEKVTKDMKVWDGIEWVSHDGVIYQGEKYVMEYQGLIATPDHVVLTDVGAMPFYLAKFYCHSIQQSNNYLNSNIDFFYEIGDNPFFIQEFWYEDTIRRSSGDKIKGYGFRNHYAISSKSSTRRFWNIAKWFTKKALAYKW